MDQSVYQISKSQVLNADLLSSNIVDLNANVKAMKFDELYDELKQMQRERDELQNELGNEIESKAALKGDLEVRKMHEKALAQQLEEYLDQLEHKEKEAQETGAKLKMEEELNKKQTKKFKKLIETLEYYTSKGYANAKLILNLYKEDPNLVSIVNEQIIERLQKFNEEPDDVKRETAKLSLLMEEFVKIIVYVRNAIDDKAELVKELNKTIKASIVANQQVKTSAIKEPDVQNSAIVNRQNFAKAEGRDQALQTSMIQEYQQQQRSKIMNEQGFQTSMLYNPRENKNSAIGKSMAMQTSMIKESNVKQPVDVQEQGFQTSMLYNPRESKAPIDGKSMALQTSLLKDHNIKQSVAVNEQGFQTSIMPETSQIKASVYEKGIDALKLSKLFEKEIEKERIKEQEREAELEKEKQKLYDLEREREIQRQEEREQERKMYQEREDALRKEVERSNEGFRRLEEHINLLKDKLNDNHNVELTNKLEKLKNKIDNLKEENSTLSGKVSILSAANEELQKDNDEKVMLLLRNIRDLKKLNGTFSEDETELHKPSEFAKYEFAEKFKKEIDTLESLMEDLKLKATRLNQSKIRPVEEKKNEGKNVYVLQEELKKLGKTNTELEQGLSEAYQKIKELRKQNKELFEKQHKMSLHEAPKMVENFSNRRQAEHKAELEAKDKVVASLIRVNDELTEKLKVFQAEKLRVLKDKRNCEELYVYFDQKATEIYLLNEKVAKLVGENKRLRRLAEELFYITNKENEENKKILEETSKTYAEVIDEVQQVMVVAATDEEFNPSAFKQVLNSQGKDEDISKTIFVKKTKPDQKQEAINEKTATNEKQTTTEQKAIEKGDLVAPMNASKIPKAKELKLADVETITKLSHVLIENHELRSRLDVRDRQLSEFGRDLQQYKKKVKSILMIEPKMEKVIAQNLKLKSMLLEIQDTSMQRALEEEVKVQDLQNHAEMAHELVDTAEDALKRLIVQKKALEKKNFILTNQKTTLTTEVETVKEKEARIFKELTAENNKKDNQIADLEVKANKLVEAQKEIARQELEIEKLQMETASLKGTVELLEKNLEAVTSNNVSDKDQLREDITRQRKALETQIDEHKSLINAKFNLENEVAKLKEQVTFRDTSIKAKDELIRDLKIKIDKKDADISQLKDVHGETTRKLEKTEFELKVLQTERNALTEDNSMLKQRIETFIDKNSTYISEERSKLNKELTQQYTDKINKLEEQLYAQHKELGEHVYTIEKKEREIADLKTKLQMKNKQLVQFNSYFASMGSTKGSKDIEVSRILLQNKTLLRELELLRSQKAHLKELYDRLVYSIDNKQASPPSDLEASQINDEKLVNLKQNLEQLYIDNYNLKAQFDVLVACYEEKLTLKDKDMDALKNRAIKFENDARYFEEELKALKIEYEDISQENELLKDKNASLGEENSKDKNIINDVKNRNRLLTEQIESLKEQVSKVELGRGINASII